MRTTAIMVARGASGERPQAPFHGPARPAGGGTTGPGGEADPRQTVLRLVFLPRGDEPARWWLLAGGAVAERGLWRQGAADPRPGMRTIVVVPGEAAACRWLALPAGSDAQVASAAGFLLEDELAQPRERLHIALGPAGADGVRMVVIVDRERMRAWLSAVDEYGLSPSAVTPDHLLLPEPGGEETLAVALGERYAVRGTRLSLTCEPDLMPLVLGDRPCVRVDEPGAAERLMAGGAGGVLLDLRQGAFAPARAGAGRTRRVAAVLGALLLLSIPALPALKAVRYDMAAAQAERDAAALAGPARPGEPADPVARLSMRLQRARTAAALPSAAAAVFTAVEGIEGMELQSLLYRDGVFHLTAAHTNYSDIQVLRSALEASGLSVHESSAATAEDRIVSDLVLRPSP